MKIFEKFNSEGAHCPICGTHEENKKSVLIPIDGTGDNGICECLQVHLTCIDLRLNKNEMGDLLYQIIS